MFDHFALEICVESVDCAMAAERGEADRIELCSDLAADGITASAGLMKAARKYVRLPIHVIIRPRAGDFCYSAREFEIMEEDIRSAKQLGMDGLVLGILDAERRIDVERTRKLVDLGHPLPVTFHRAFDASAHLHESLEAVIQTGSTRLLTSGGPRSAADNVAELAGLVKAAGQRIAIMPGGGITATNVARIVRETAAREIHTSLGGSRAGPAKYGRKANLDATGNHSDRRSASLETKVRKLRDLIATVAGV
jgi:copper homeostasis protein